MALKFNFIIPLLTFVLISGCNIVNSEDGSHEDYLESGSDSAIAVLFIGSSYFGYNDLPAFVKKLTESNAGEIKISTRIINGYFLSDHAENENTDLKIKEKKWDYVILQGVGSIMAYPERDMDHLAYPALVTLQNKILANCETTKIIFCMPWAFEDGMTWLEGWTDDYSDMQIKIYDRTLRYSDDIGFIVAPVGWAWNTVLYEKNYPLHYLHLSDWNHPSQKGSYLMACVIYSTIFKESTSGFSFIVGFPEDEAILFQDVASSTVLDSLSLWNIE